MQVTVKQLQARNKLAKSEGGALWWRVGTGKTRITLSWFAFNAKISKLSSGNFLVVCRREAFADWKEEMYKVGLHWRLVELESPHQFGLDLFKCTRPTLYIMSHGKLANMKFELGNFAQFFQGVAYDEGYLYKNAQSQRCKAANHISNLIGKALILSGSVMTARNTEDIFGQLYAINRHQPIGRTLTDFRSRYRFELRILGGTFDRQQGYRGPSYINRRNSERNITEKIRDFTSVYFPANNQRRIIEATRMVGASRSQSNAFKDLRKLYWLRYKGEELDIKNTPTLITKCQQISDGWIKMGKSLEGTEGVVYNLPICEKLEYLKGKVEELLDAGEKPAIWCAFKHSVDLVLHQMQKTFPSVGVYGLTGGKKFDRDGWNRNGRIFVGTEASGSSFNFLKHCAYSIYYSMDFHWLHLQQSQGRTNRLDSDHATCFYDFLHTYGSLDDHVLKMVRLSASKETELLTLAAVQSWLHQ